MSIIEGHLTESNWIETSEAMKDAFAKQMLHAAIEIIAPAASKYTEGECAHTVVAEAMLRALLLLVLAYGLIPL